MRKVAHEKVLAHLVEVYLKNRPYFGDDCWYETETPLWNLYNTHADFRGYPTPKDIRYVDVFSLVIAPLINSGAITFMPDRLLPPSHIFCLECPMTGRIFVIDGSMRVFNGIQYEQTALPVYLYRGGVHDD